MTIKETLMELWRGSCDSSTSESDSGHLRIFDPIIEHNKVKRTISLVLKTKKPANVLLIGPPGTSKTLFLEIIHKAFGKESVFAQGYATTKAGLTDALFNNTPKYLCIDEIEEMSKADQAILLGFMGNGRVSETKRSSTRETNLKTWVFATCNDITKLKKQVFDRFIPIEIKPYTRAEFESIGLELLEREHIDPEIAKEAIRIVYEKRKQPSLRTVMQVAGIAENVKDVEDIVSTLK